MSLFRRFILGIAARLPSPQLDNCDADVAAKRAAVARQLRQAMLPHAKVTCGCGFTLPIRLTFRCLYCGEFYCQRCAEIHFGKTRAAYEHERADLGLSVSPEGRVSSVEGTEAHA